MRKIVAGVANSEAGAISRFVTIVKFSTRVRWLGPAVCSVIESHALLERVTRD